MSQIGFERPLNFSKPLVCLVGFCLKYLTPSCPWACKISFTNHRILAIFIQLSPSIEGILWKVKLDFLKSGGTEVSFAAIFLKIRGEFAAVA